VGRIGALEQIPVLDYEPSDSPEIASLPRAPDGLAGLEQAGEGDIDFRRRGAELGIGQDEAELWPEAGNDCFDPFAHVGKAPLNFREPVQSSAIRSR